MTAIGPVAAQLEYRLSESAGCGPARERADAQVGYRTDEGERARLTWFGGGLADVGLVAGAGFGEGDVERARALMDGLHPRTGEVLVKPKVVAHPAAQLPARLLLAELTAVAERAGVDVAALPASVWGRERVARIQRGLAKSGGHRVRLTDIERLADALPDGVALDLDRLYGPRVMAAARAHREHKVRIGDRGFDLTLDIPKSPSVVWALGDPATAAALQGAFRKAVHDTLAQVEAWCGYAMRGQHGGGRTARRVPTSGLLGWVMWHDVARPVHGQAPDPHLHAHAVIAHLAKGQDGRWSTPGNGGRELHRHVQAIGALLHARFRARTTALGFAWVQDGGRDGTGWELAGVPVATRQLYSKRAGQTDDMLTRLGADPQSASTRQRKAAAGMCREGKHPAPTPPTGTAGAPARGHDGDVRTNWRRQALAAGIDIAAMLTAARPHPPRPPGPAGPPAPDPAPRPGPAPAAPPAPAAAPVRQVVAAFATRHAGPAAGRMGRVVTQPRMLATVLDTLPAGGTAEHAQALADAALALPDAPLTRLQTAPGHPGARGPAHQTHPYRYQPRHHRRHPRHDVGHHVDQEAAELASPAPVPADYLHQLRTAAADLAHVDQLLDTLPAAHPAWPAIARATADLYAALTPKPQTPGSAGGPLAQARRAAHAAAAAAPDHAAPPHGVVAVQLAVLRRHQQTAAHVRPALNQALGTALHITASGAQHAVRALVKTAGAFVAAAARLLHTLTTWHHRRHRQSSPAEPAAPVPLEALVHTHLEHLGELARPPTPTATTNLQQPAQPAPAAPASWRTRPYGTLTDRQLAAAADRYRAELAAHRHAQPYIDTELARARAGHGPAAAVLNQRRQVLAAAAAAEAQLPAAQDAIDRARADLSAARERADHALARTQRGRAALRLSGSSRAQADADHAAARQALRRARADLQAAQNAHQQLHAQAAAPYAPAGRRPQPGQSRGQWMPGVATRDHADLTASWDDQHVDAIRQDLDTATSRGRRTATGLDEPTQQAARAYAAALHPGHRPTHTADEATAKLSAVHAEQQLRRALPPGQAKQENTERNDHLNHQRAAAQHRAYRRPTPTRNPGHDPGLRR